MPLKNHFLAAALVAAFAAGGCSTLASAVAPSVSAEPAALRAGAYALDPAHASLLFKVDHLGFSDYVGRFETFDASLDFDADNPEASRVDAVIQIASLDIANDDFAETLKGAGWFSAGDFPEAVFRSTGVTVAGENTGVMTGDLTLRGVTQEIALDVTFNGGAQDRLRGAYVVGFSANGTFSRSAFGIDKFSGLVGDDVAIEIEAEFERR